MKAFHLLVLRMPTDEACSGNTCQQETCECRYDLFPVHVEGRLESFECEQRDVVALLRFSDEVFYVGFHRFDHLMAA